MALILTSLTAVSITAGTRKQITSSNIAASNVLIQSNPANAGNVFVGDSTVDSDNGHILEPGASYIITGDERRYARDEVILSEIYVDGSSTNDNVRISYLANRSGTNP